MKKLLYRAALTIGTVGVVAGGAAAFSAFEAHIINVTATIENALSVPIEARGLTYGTVFPQEAFDQQFDVRLSSSFLEENRVDDVEYTIRQKPKCGVVIPQTNPVQYSGFKPVTEDTEHNFVCPQGSIKLPLLCPYLSKNEITTDGTAPENDPLGHISSFHGTTATSTWTLATTLSRAVFGKLQKSVNDTLDTWNIDLHAPCFVGQCAQDWATFVHQQDPQADPNAFMADPTQEHQMFGCDLWLETTGISTTTPPINPGP